MPTLTDPPTQPSRSGTDTTSLAEHKTALEANLKRVAETGRPLVVDGVSPDRVVVVTEAEYDPLRDRADLLQSAETCDRAMRQHQAGLGRPAREVIAEIAREVGVDLPALRREPADRPREQRA